jgi:hypothetical protein
MGLNMIEKIKKINELCVKDGTYKNEKGQTTVSLWSKIKYFRQVFGAELGFNTNVMEYEDYYICKATILAYDPERILSSGHYKQFKKKNGTYLQGALPMAESFAISRALSLFGIMDKDISSKEEYEALNIPSIKEIKDTSKQGSVPVDQIIEEIKKSPHLTRLNNLRFVKYKEQFDLAIKKFPSIYRDLDDVYNTKKQHINKQEKI